MRMMFTLLDFYRANTLKQQSADRHAVPFGYNDISERNTHLVLNNNYLLTHWIGNRSYTVPFNDQLSFQFGGCYFYNNSFM
jgi:hypothetical protein